MVGKSILETFIRKYRRQFLQNRWNETVTAVFFRKRKQLQLTILKLYIIV